MQSRLAIVFGIHTADDVVDLWRRQLQRFRVSERADRKHCRGCSLRSECCSGGAARTPLKKINVRAVKINGWTQVWVYGLWMVIETSGHTRMTYGYGCLTQEEVPVGRRWTREDFFRVVSHAQISLTCVHISVYGDTASECLV